MIYRDIAQIINKYIYPALIERQLNVFLIGSGQDIQNSLRDSLRKKLLDFWYNPNLGIFYPEELFDELFQGRNEIDLLHLENLLALSVHAIVIVLESAGSIAELGAFANHEVLKNRLVVIVDQKYKKEKSFIMLGPVMMLRKKTDSAVIYYNFKNTSEDNLEKLREKVSGCVRKIAKQVKPNNSIKNLIYAQFFLLATVYVMQPMKKADIIKMISSIGNETEETVWAITNASLNILLRNKELLLRSARYELTKEGLRRIQGILKYRRRVTKVIDKLRVAVLNHTMRKTKRRGTQILSSADARMLQLVDGA
jgi:hypothetical protein